MSRALAALSAPAREPLLPALRLAVRVDAVHVSARGGRCERGRRGTAALMLEKR